jgi:hypothetical protein
MRAMVFDNLAAGCMLAVDDHKTGQPWATLINMEAAPGGSIQVRPAQSETPLAEPTDGSLLSEEVIALIPVQRQGACMARLIATATRLFYWEPEAVTNNLRLLFTFDNPVKTLDFCMFLNRTYIATGTNYLLEWDGFNAPHYCSEKYWEGYRKPHTCCTWNGLLVLGAFRDEPGAAPQSELATTGAEDASQLIDAPLDVASKDTEVIQGVAATAWGLLVGKDHSCYAVTGTNFSLVDSDITVRLHTPLAGFVGPRAWVTGPNAEIYFLDARGVFMASTPMDASLEISFAIAPIFGYSLSHSAVPYPKAGPDLSTASMAIDPIYNQLKVTFPGVSP